MHWIRKPRLNSAVATVAVETVFSLLRVASVSFDMASSQVTRLINRRFIDRRAESGLEEIEIAALVGLFDVPRNHPAIAALESALRLLPIGAAFGELGLGHIEVDGAGGDIQRDAVAILHQRQRAADIGFRRHMQDAGAVA